MRSTNFFSILLVCLIVLACRQPAKSQSFQREIYSQFIESVLPLKFKDRKFKHGFIIRVRPSFESEFLLKIEVHDREVEITRVVSESGNLYSFTLSILEEDGNANVNKLTSIVKMRTETKRFRSRDFEAMRKLFKSKLGSLVDQSARYGTIPPSTATVIIHGTTYQVLYQNSSGEYLTTWAYDYSLEANSFNSPIVDWIKRILKFYETNQDVR